MGPGANARASHQQGEGVPLIWSAGSAGLLYLRTAVSQDCCISGLLYLRTAVSARDWHQEAFLKKAVIS
jgi:hypothetical protein